VSPAWGGFITATDIQRVDAFLRRTYTRLRRSIGRVRRPTFHSTESATTPSKYVLYSLLPPPSAASQNYDWRPRCHDRQLPGHASHLMDCDFITRFFVRRRLLIDIVEYCWRYVALVVVLLYILNTGGTCTPKSYGGAAPGAYRPGLYSYLVITAFELMALLVVPSVSGAL